MPATSVNLEKRVSTLTSVLTGQTEQHAVEMELQAANGDWAAALDRLTDVRRITLRASSLHALSQDL
jgi:hypothetical protein